MALAAPATAATPPITRPARLPRWLWLATTVFSGACFVALMSHPAQAQERDAPRLKTERDRKSVV